MGLGGVRGLWVGEGPFLRRLPNLTLSKVGTTRWAVGRFRHYPAGAGGDYLTIQALNNVAIRKLRYRYQCNQPYSGRPKSPSDNPFSLTSTYRQISPGNSGKPWDVLRIRISCLVGPSPSLRSHAAQAI